MLRRCLLVVAVLLVIGGPLALRAQAGETPADLTAMTNADRTRVGLRPLATANDLQSLAQQRATEMARSGRLAHTSNLGTKVSGWKRLGENVGRGPNLRDIQTAFMASPSHKENIVDPGFTQLGVGVTWDGKEYFYVAVIFRTPSGTASAPAPAPASPPTTRRATPPTTRAASTPPKPRPTTTTAPPTTTTTTTTLPAPPPPPVEVAALEVPPPPPPVETTTTTAPRPIFTDRDFLAANFSDPIVPVAVTKPLPNRPLTPIFLAAVLGLLVGSACTAVALRQPAQLASEWVRLRHWR